MGQVQTETAYYQPNPNAMLPFPSVASINETEFCDVVRRLDRKLCGWLGSASPGL